jgi:hypothetical protein
MHAGALLPDRVAVDELDVAPGRQGSGGQWALCGLSSDRLDRPRACRPFALGGRLRLTASSRLPASLLAHLFRFAISQVKDNHPLASIPKRDRDRRALPFGDLFSRDI